MDDLNTGYKNLKSWAKKTALGVSLAAALVMGTEGCMGRTYVKDPETDKIVAESVTLGHQPSDISYNKETGEIKVEAPPQQFLFSPYYYRRHGYYRGYYPRSLGTYSHRTRIRVSGW